MIFVNDSSKYDEDIEFLIQYLKDEYNIKQKLVLGSVVNDVKKINISYNDAIITINKERTTNNIYKNKYYEKEMKNFNENIYYLKKYISENINNMESVIKVYDKFTKLIE